MTASGAPRAPRAYKKLLRLAAGGMGTVHVGVLEGALGFRQLVALKEAHPHLALDIDARRAIVEEALLASRIHHANVVEVRDVEVSDDTVTLVMPYIEGASLAQLLSRALEAGVPAPIGVVLRILLDSAAGLAAAHELENEAGVKLGVVHRDVSPENLLVGADGVTRVGDFGVAKYKRADGYATSEGVFKGKIAYAAPEALRGQAIDARLDVFSLGVVAWEALSQKRLFRVDGDLETVERVQRHKARPVSEVNLALRPLDEVIAKALEKSKSARFSTMTELLSALERASVGLVGTHRDVAAFVKAVLGPALDARREQLRERMRNPEDAGSGPTLIPEASTVIAVTPPPAGPVVEGSISLRGVGLPRRTPKGTFVAAGLVGVALVAALAFALRGTSAPPSVPARSTPAAPSEPERIAAPRTSDGPTVEATTTPPPEKNVAAALPSAPAPTPTASAPARPKSVRPDGKARPPLDLADPPPPPPNPYGRK